jgi:hypothetical protein
MLLSVASSPDGEPALSPGRTLQPGISRRLAGGSGEAAAAIGWGYDFPWQGKAFLQPRHAPTAVVTSFVVDAFEASGSPAAGIVARGAAGFVLSSLARHESSDGICFSYSPRDRTRVYNASLLAARILVTASSHDTGASAEYRRLASEACRFVLSRQARDGSWRYGDGREWRWIDGFHTGFVLESLHSMACALGRDDWQEAVGRGLRFYRAELFRGDGAAMTSPGRPYPLDPHSFAQGAITFAALAGLDPDGPELAGMILRRAVDLLWDDRRAGFIYSRGRVLENRAIHLRWCQAWMLRAICAAGPGGGRD